MNNIGLLCLFMCSLVSGFILPSTKNLILQNEIHVDVRHNFQEHARLKRNVQYLPEVVNLNVNVSGETKVIITVRKNDIIDVNIPIYNVRNGHIVLKDVEQMQGTGLYQDPANGASFMLQRLPGSVDFNIIGSFFVDSIRFFVQPNGTNIQASQDQIKHDVYKIPNQEIVYESMPPPVKPLSFTQRPAQRNNQRHKRQGRTLLEIELLIVTDYAVYQAWYNRVTGSNRDLEAVKQLRQYYGFMLNEIDARYQNIQTSDYQYRILSSGIIVLDNPADASWAEENKQGDITTPMVYSSSTLDSFNDWVAGRNDLPPNDHVMGFTGYNLVAPSDSVDSDSKGIAFSEAICSDASVSLVEDAFEFVGMATAAHELGHSLGSNHDGDRNACSSSDNYIMAPTAIVRNSPLTQNLWHFSSCSVQKMRDYVVKLNSQGNNCMLRRSGGSTLPGNTQTMAEVYSPDETCVYTFGAGSYTCRSIQNYTTICSLMYCNSPGTTQCFGVLPPENTPCGKGKWCYQGECIASPDAPTDIEDDCPLGDRPGFLNDNGVFKTCPQLVNEFNGVCYSEFIAKACCSSCKAAKRDNQGCPYGDKTEQCTGISSFACYNNEDLCCGTCLPLKNSTRIDCEYGDKFSGCQASSCDFYVPESLAGCCSTCNSFKTAPPTQRTTPTTPSPTTPTTPSPTTRAPTTPSPTTKAPSTPSPTTKAPTTPKPTTRAPTTPSPTTKAPTTPSTPSPTTKAPSTPTPESTTTPIKTSTDETEPEGKFMLVGIATGAGAIVIIIIITVICCLRRQRKAAQNSGGNSSTGKNTYDNLTFTSAEAGINMPQHPPPRRNDNAKPPPLFTVANHPRGHQNMAFSPSEKPHHPPPRRNGASPSAPPFHNQQTNPVLVFPKNGTAQFNGSKY